MSKSWSHIFTLLFVLLMIVPPVLFLWHPQASVYPLEKYLEAREKVSSSEEINQKWKENDHSNIDAIASIFSAYAAMVALILVYWQSRMLHKTLELQMNLASLNQVKLRVETLFRGAALPISNQAIPNSSEDEEMKKALIDQLCAVDETHRKLAEKLINRWFDLENRLEK